MLPGGDRIVPHVHYGIHRRGSCAVVVIPRGNGGGGDVVPGPHIPDRFCRAIKQTRWLAVRQTHIKPVVKLAVGKNVRIQLTGVIHLRTPVNPHLRQNAPDKLKVRFPPLGDNFPRRVGALQAEFKISALQPVLAQHLLHHLRHGLVLKDGALPGVSQQRQARTEREPVVRLVLRGGQPFQAGHHAVDIFAATHPEGGIFHQHLFRWNVRLRGGKLNVPPEGFAQGFPATKAQNIRLH
ncbi:Uncharacterised protein [Klebsiella pneumoniae]|nr:Uncharacterised protein [Klebsiella pneumoniae]